MHIRLVQKHIRIQILLDWNKNHQINRNLFVNHHSKCCFPAEFNVWNRTTKRGKNLTPYQI